MTAPRGRTDTVLVVGNKRKPSQNRMSSVVEGAGHGWQGREINGWRLNFFERHLRGQPAEIPETSIRVAAEMTGRRFRKITFSKTSSIVVGPRDQETLGRQPYGLGNTPSLRQTLTTSSGLIASTM
jgi:hypothetical protein